MLKDPLLKQETSLVKAGKILKNLNKKETSI